MTDPSAHLFWITSRAAGITAMVLASGSVGIGLAMGGRLLKRAIGDLRSVHEVLSLSVMIAIALHGLSLLGDAWFHASILDVTIPFIGSYKTLPTSIGIVAGWGLVILGLSFYGRRRIGARRWRSIHRYTVLAWLFALIHAFTEGTDAGQLWFIALIGVTAAPALTLLAVRAIRPAQPRSRPTTPATQS